MNALRGRVVVVSPHLDDAVLSIGAAISSAAGRGAAVVVLTVFAGDPDSDKAAGEWDRRSGFRTEGEAARRRRVEDRRACEILGVAPVWLRFSDEQYEQGREERVILDTVRDVVAGAHVVLVPGLPLENHDHRWLSGALLAPPSPIAARVGLYVEQPYAHDAGILAPRPGVPGPPSPLLPTAPHWSRTPAGVRDVLAKWRAVRAYRSQLFQLGIGRRKLLRVLWGERRRGGELVAWLPESTG